MFSSLAVLATCKISARLVGRRCGPSGSHYIVHRATHTCAPRSRGDNTDKQTIPRSILKDSGVDNVASSFDDAVDGTKSSANAALDLDQVEHQNQIVAVSGRSHQAAERLTVRHPRSPSSC